MAGFGGTPMPVGAYKGTINPALQGVPNTYTKYGQNGYATGTYNGTTSGGPEWLPQYLTDPMGNSENAHMTDLRDATKRGELASASMSAALGGNLPASLKGLFGSTGGAGGPVTEPSDDDETGARNAAFARAKDTAGNLARAAIDSLHGEASSRGVNVAGGDNPLLMRGEADVVGATGNMLGEVSREQMIQDLQRAREKSDRNYAGNITMRGQDMSQAQSLMSLMNSQLGRLY